MKNVYVCTIEGSDRLSLERVNCRGRCPGANGSRGMVGAADAIEMVLDAAGEKIDLVEFVQLIDQFQLGLSRRLGGRARARGGKGRTDRGNLAAQHVAPMHCGPPAQVRGANLSFMTKCGEFLAVGHEFGTFAELGAIDAKNLVVGAGQQGIGGIVIRFVAIPNHDPLKPDDGGFAIFRQRQIDAAAFAIDAAAETDFVTGVLGNDVIAIAAGIEIAGAAAVFDAEAK